MKERQRLLQLEPNDRLTRLRYLDREIRKSFIGELLTLLFGITYGLTLITVNRNDIPPAGLSGSQDTVGFGQLVPLFLMALPLLAAGEVCYGKSGRFELWSQGGLLTKSFDIRTWRRQQRSDGSYCCEDYLTAIQCFILWARIIKQPRQH